VASWSDAVGEADWIRDRLTPFQQDLAPPAETGGSASYRAGSTVPRGFEAYARVLHPLTAWTPAEGWSAMRWGEVAAWSGRPIGRETQFHSIALPPERPAGEVPFAGRRPQIGAPSTPDALVLVEVLRGATATPERCFFCLWDGYSWEGRWPVRRWRGPSGSGEVREWIPSTIPEETAGADGERNRATDPHPLTSSHVPKHQDPAWR